MKMENSTADIEQIRFPAVRRNIPSTRTGRCVARDSRRLASCACSPEAKSKQEYQYPSARSDDAMWGQLV